jgi:chlorobactene glucosyltransferase
VVKLANPPLWLSAKHGSDVELIASAAVLLSVVALFVRAVRQAQALQTLQPSYSAPEGAPEIAVVIPARNEAANIGACLSGLIAQTYPPARLRIIVVDDNSSDRTAEIVAGFAQRGANVTLLRSGPLAQGWTGKSQACWIGARTAGDAQWLCFVDADTKPDPPLAASAVAAAQERRVDLLSLAPRQRLVSFAERLMVPCGLYLLSFGRDLPRREAPDSGRVAATGQFLLIRRAAYDAIGGHAAVAGAICEDLELARLADRTGRSVLLMNGGRLISARMYDGWSTLWPGFAKNLLDMFGGAAASLTMAAAALALSGSLVLLPIVDFAHCQNGSASACVALALAGPGALAALGFHIAGALYLGVPFWYGFLFPLGYLLGAAMVLDSVRRRALGRVAWKGRVYHG